MPTVREGNMENPIYRFLYRVGEHILAEEAGRPGKVIFARRKISYAYGDGHIEFGYESVRNSWEGGFYEYVNTARRVGWERCSEPGWEAIRRLCLHEAAHGLQYAGGDPTGDGNHGPSFAKCLKFLDLVYPMGRCMKIASVGLDDGMPGVEVDDSPLSFKVILRSKKQWWSWKREGNVVVIRISSEWWSVMTVEEQLMLDEYIKARASRDLRGGSVSRDLEMRYARLRRTIGQRR